jgi:peptide/nickel transport system ATP-binding protein
MSGSCSGTESAVPAPTLDVEGLEVSFPVRAGLLNRVVGSVRAVDGVSFTIGEGETLGLVGESGSGKTTIGRAILRAVDPSAGKVLFRPDVGPQVDLARLGSAELRALRPQMQLVFQDPYSSLNPRMTVHDIIAEPLAATGLASRSELTDRVVDVADRCKIDRNHLRRYPHAFSGGQRQRIGIARALIGNPRLVVADEPVSALDVSIQAEILNLLADIQAESGVSILFISHDMSVVSHLSDRVAVLYLGQLVELASTEELFNRPKHPYTEALLSAIPTPGRRASSSAIRLIGETPGHDDVPSGCRFNPRCRYAVDRCRTEEPSWRTLDDDRGHQRLIRCHLAEELELNGATTETE